MVGDAPAEIAHAELAAAIDAVVALCSRGEHAAEVLRAKTELEARQGQLFEDDALYEPRMSAFLEWYAVERPLSAEVPGAGAAPVVWARTQGLPGVEDDMLAALAGSQRSLFRMLETRPASVLLEDLIGGGLWEVDERRKIAGLGEGDLFEARLYGVRGRVVFGRDFLTHPLEAEAAIVELCTRAGRGDAAARLGACDKLASLRVKAERYRNLPAARLYAGEAGTWR